MDLVNFLRVLSKRKYILIIVPLITIVIAYFLTKNLPDVYSSDAQIATGLTEESKINFSSKETEEKDSQIKQKFSNLIEVMKSKRILDLVSYHLLIHDLTSEKPFRPLSKQILDLSNDARISLVAKLKSNLDSIQSLNFDKKEDKAIIKIIESMRYDENSLSDKLKIKRVETSDFLNIAFESENGELCAFVVNNLCKVFIDFYKDRFKGKQLEELEFWARLLEQKKKELDAKVEVLKNYKIKNRVINLYEQTKSVDGQIAGMEVRREEINKFIPGYKEAIKDINSRLTSDERKYLEYSISPYNKDINNLKDKLKFYNDRALVVGPEDKAIQDSIISIRNSISTKVRALTDEYLVNPNAPKQELVMKKLSYELELDIAENQVKSIDRDINRLRQKFDTYTPLEGTIQAYERDVDVAAKVYLTILSRFNEANLSTNLEAKLEQTQTGIPGPPQPSKKMLIIILAGLISIVLCVVIIFILDYLDLTIRSPKKFILLTKTTLIGCLNLIKGKSLNLETLFKSIELNPEYDTFKQLLRSLRFEIEQSMAGNKSLLITSTEDKEGKTLILTSLAYVLALSDKKILLIDTNFKNNSLTKNFSANPVLEKLIRKEISFNEAITKTKNERIDVIGCHGGGLTPQEVGGIQKLIDCLTSAKECYDYILLEGPSLVKYSSSKELSSVADKVVCIFSAMRVLKEPDRNAIEYLKSEVSDKFIGSILNNVELENLELFYGEIPKKRSFIRKFIKKILTRNLSGADKLTKKSSNITFNKD